MPTRGEALQMEAVNRQIAVHVEYFRENALLPQDGALLYRAIVPCSRSSAGRTCLRIQVDRLRDTRLRSLLGDGLLEQPEPEIFEVGLLRIHRLGRHLYVACRLAPDEDDTLLFVLQNRSNRLWYVPAPQPGP